jgi:hypothetical protein
MTNFINKIYKAKDEVEASKLIDIMEKFYDGNTHISQDKLTSVFHRANKLYKRYANAFAKALNDNNDAAIDFNFTMFAHSSVLCSLILSRQGLYEAEREVIDYFVSSMKPSFNVPAYMTSAMNNMNSENALRLAVVKADNPQNKEEVAYYLDMVQDYVYQQVDMAKPEKIGEIALFQFMKGNTERSLEYLNMQLQKYSGNIDKVIKTEITNNEALFTRSSTGRKYKKFVEDFISLQACPKPQPSV